MCIVTIKLIIILSFNGENEYSSDINSLDDIFFLMYLKELHWPQQECLRSLLRVSDWESSKGSVPGSTAIFWLSAGSIRPAFKCCCVDPQVSLPDKDFQASFILLISWSVLFQKNNYSQRDHHASWLHRRPTLTCKYPCTLWHTQQARIHQIQCRGIVQPL